MCVSFQKMPYFEICGSGPLLPLNIIIVFIIGGHLGFQVTLTSDNKSIIFIQSVSPDLVGIDTSVIFPGQTIFELFPFLVC